MTGDESFIRAIVAAPGENATRLVYADWLQKRGDPRGAYLRAENEGSLSGVAALPDASRLDRVWVARVSRPPVGVCSDGFENTDANVGSPLSLADISAAQDRLGLLFPPEYVAFVLNFNGWGPTKNYFRIPGLAGDSVTDVRRFLALHRPDEPDWRRGHLDLEFFASERRAGRMTIRERLPSYLPIALGYSGHNLLIGVADSNVGQIAFSCDYPNRMAGVHSVAASLGTFLAMLTSQPPEWVRLLRARDAAGVVRWLDLGGDPDAYSGYIGGALEYASRTQQWDVAAALIARGARLPDDREQLLEYDAPEWFRKVVHAL